MNICIIGVGYVGLATGLSLCIKGHRVKFYDSDRNKTLILNDGRVPFYEKGMEKALQKCIKRGSAIFTNNLKKALDEAAVIFICVNAPTLPRGKTDLTSIKSLFSNLNKLIKRKVTIAIKTTINPDDYLEVKKLLKNENFHLAVNPEFLREGSALKDSINPFRIVIGTDDENSKKDLENLYSNFNVSKIFTDPLSAIIIKYASNSFLAVKISFINEIANLCDKIGANIDDVATGIGLDPRIGKDFLRAGIGFGGSCLPKDSKNLASFSERAGAKTSIVQKTCEINEVQFLVTIDKLKKVLGNLKGKTIAVLGLAFKGGTDDLRDSVSLKIIKDLKKQEVIVKAHDYMAYEKAEKLLKDIFISGDIYLVVEDCDALIIATDWQEYKRIDWKRIRKAMHGTLIIDGRNVLEAKNINKLGFVYYGIGRNQGSSN